MRFLINLKSAFDLCQSYFEVFSVVYQAKNKKIYTSADVMKECGVLFWTLKRLRLGIALAHVTNRVGRCQLDMEQIRKELIGISWIK